MRPFAILSLGLVMMACGAPAPSVPAASPTLGEVQSPTEARRETGKLADGSDAPPWSTGDRLTKLCDNALAQARALRATIPAKASEAGGESKALDAYNQMFLELDAAYGFAALSFQVHPDEAVRKAGQTCVQALEKFINDANLDRQLHDTVAAIETGDLDPLAQRFVSRVLRDFRRSGVDKDQATRDQLVALHAKMVELSQSYHRNLRDDVRFIELDGPDQLEGLPADYIAAHPPGDNGKIRVTTDYPDFFPFQTYAVNGTHREALYKVFVNRGFPANKPILEELLSLRHTYANLLGHPTWAAYHAEDKMVKTAKRVDAFIAELASIARPRMNAEVQELLARKQKDQADAKRLEAWDRFYYAGKVREEKHDFDARTVRPYFTYPRVKAGILDLYGMLFGVEFEAQPDEPVWHPSVEAYVMKTKGEIVARFYLDMHPREGKYKHAAMFPMQTGLDVGRTPVAALVCNFPAPDTPQSKPLMEHRQVVTLFHEFGHLIHHLLARHSRWHNQAGINVEWDFVEAPSQLLEEWAWDTGVLQRFARHIDTGEPIPNDLVRRMRAAEEFGKGVNVMRQVFYAAFSFYLHARPPASFNLDTFTGEIYDQYSPYPAVEGGHLYANFGHLVGYSSGYYTYQWSLVIAKDLFNRFREEGLLNPSVAESYRKAILEPGATRDAVDLVESFLGRPYTLDAYKAWLLSE